MMPFGAMVRPGGALSAAEAQQLARYAAMQAGSGAGGTSRRRPEQPSDPYDASWMHPSGPRDHPLVRAAAAGQHQHSLAADARCDDGVDVAALVSRRTAWSRVYRDVWRSGMDRDQAALMWRLLHKGLPCGALRLYTVPPAGDDRAAALMACCCQAGCCAGVDPAAASTSAGVGAPAAPPLETLSHLFWGCPSVAPAVDWLWDLWRQVAGAPPPKSEGVLLLGAWQPVQRVHRRLWLLLRAAYISAVWGLSHRRRAAGQQFDARAVVQVVRARLAAAIRVDYVTASSDLPAAAGLGARWFRTRRNQMSSLLEFKEVWCAGGVLADAVDDGSGGTSLALHIPSFLEAAALAGGTAGG